MGGTLALLIQSLRVDARLVRTHLFRFFFVFIIYILLSFSHLMSMMMGAAGLYFFTSIAWLNLGFVILCGIGFFSTALTEEKEEATLGLLLMAGISRVGLLLGKSTSRMLSAMMLLLVQIPFALLAITLGGVTWMQVAATYLALLAFMTLVANMALLCSVICKRSGSAAALTLVLLMGFLFSGVLVELIADELIAPSFPEFAAALERFSGYLYDALIALRLPVILATGFDQSALSFQVISNFIGAVTLFGISWAIFHFMNYEQHSSPSRGLLFKRTSLLRMVGTGRAWTNPFIWKDFHFITGGIPFTVAKFVLYGGILLLYCYISSTEPGGLQLDNVGGWLCVTMLVVLGVELSLYASRVFHDEIKWKTLLGISMLPRSTAYIAASKSAGCLLALLPGMAYFGLGLLLSPDWLIGFFEAMISPGVWIGILIYLIFVHLTALLSLFVKWGALPLAIGIMLVSYPFTSMIFVICMLLGMITGSTEAMMLPAVFILVGIIIGLDFWIVQRLKTVGAR